MQFFKHNGHWVNTDQMRRIRKILDIKSQRFCMFCTSLGNRHKKDCPTHQPDFNPENTPKINLDGTPFVEGERTVGIPDPILKPETNTINNETSNQQDALK